MGGNISNPEGKTTPPRIGPSVACLGLRNWDILRLDIKEPGLDSSGLGKLGHVL